MINVEWSCCVRIVTGRIELFPNPISKEIGRRRSFKKAMQTHMRELKNRKKSNNKCDPLNYVKDFTHQHPPHAVIERKGKRVKQMPIKRFTFRIVNVILPKSTGF